MDNISPLVSVLICTYNRSQVLRRSITSVLNQTFKNLELIIIDDCSTDETKDVIDSFNDKRIRYIHNPVNIGSVKGDRAHVRRFVYELSKGKYFVYLCDDDYWFSHTLLQRQVDAFHAHENVAMVVGGQLSHFITEEERELNISDVAHISYNDRRKVSLPPTMFFKDLYAKSYMTSKEFLMAFATDPVNRNIVAGATLYSKEHFIAAGAMSTETGSKWQAGYEFSMGPACYGNVVYLDEPAVIVEVRPTNASFGGTQVDHYKDCMVSIDTAFATPLKKNELQSQKLIFQTAKREVIRHVSRAFLSNTLTIKIRGQLTACSENNMSAAVTPKLVLRYFLMNRIIPKIKDLKYLLVVSFPPTLVKIITRGHPF